MEDQLGALGLVLNCITLWNTVYLDAALARLRDEDYPVRDEDVARLSAYMRRHLNVHGHYSFQLPDLAGARRALRDPAASRAASPECAVSRSSIGTGPPSSEPRRGGEGCDAALEARRVTGARRMADTARMAPRPLVGRDTQLGELRAAARHVAAGGSAVVLVTGEPGIGKTRLVAELAAGAPCPVLVGRADPEEGAPPLWPWLQALSGRPERTTLTTIGATPLPTRTADPGSATMLATAARTLAFDSVLDGLAASTAGTGLVVVLEDLHWADESTLRLLVLAAGRPGLGVVGTDRPTERGPALRATLTDLRRLDCTRTLALRPWTLDHVAAHQPAHAHPSWAPVLLRAGGGNPLLVGALLRALTDTGLAGAPAPGDGSWPLGVPDDLADVTA